MSFVLQVAGNGIIEASDITAIEATSQALSEAKEETAITGLETPKFQGAIGGTGLSFGEFGTRIDLANLVQLMQERSDTRM